LVGGRLNIQPPAELFVPLDHRFSAVVSTVFKAYEYDEDQSFQEKVFKDLTGPL